MKYKTSTIYLIAIFLTTIIAILFINIVIQDIKGNIGLMGFWAPICLMLLRFTSVIIPALPSTAYSLLAGGILGFKKGIIVICIADLLSCSISFLLAKKYGHKLVERLIGINFLTKIQRVSERHIENNFFLMSGILMTGLFDFFSYGIGLTKTNYFRFLYALIFSVLISNPPIVALGAGLLDGGKKYLIFSILGIFILAIITGITKNSG